MTHETMSNLADAYSVLAEQCVAERLAVTVRLPSHVCDLVSRAEVRTWIAVAVEAESHRQRLGAIGQRHRVHATVTLDAADAFSDVNIVAEEDIIGQHSHPIPFQ